MAALGYTLNSPAEDRYLATRDELKAQICGLLGGRAAEEIVFGEISTGASGDLARATQIAESMVKEYGMSRTLGLAAHREERHPNQVLGMPVNDRNYSEETARRIDEEVTAILDGGYGRAKDILEDHRETLERVVKVLFERETMEGTELRKMLGKPEVGEGTAEQAPAPAAGNDAGDTASISGAPLPAPSRAPATEGPPPGPVSPEGGA